MSGKLIYIPFLKRKLAAVYQNPASPVTKDIFLADYLGLPRSTLHLYINGSQKKPPRKPGFMSEDVLQRLVRLLMTISPAVMTESHAYSLWSGPSPDRFARTLLEGLESTLGRSLASRPAELTLAVGVLERNMHGIVDDSAEVPVNATLILPDQGVFFEFDSASGRSLIVLTEDDFGWHSLVPGRRHDGCIRSPRVRVPTAAGQGIFFKQPYCLERFVFIETLTREPLPVRLDPTARGPLSPLECERLCVALGDESRSGGAWRWGEVCVAISEPLPEAPT